VITGDGRVVHELLLPASREEVFGYFVDPTRLVRWLGIAAGLDPRPGGRFRFEVQPGEFCEGEYVEVSPPARLVVSWGWTDPSWNLPPGSSRVVVELAEDPGGTRLRLTHDRLPGELRPLHDEGWGRFLARLDAVASGAAPAPYPVERP
jgi:uncharacterized protein YndB with AHSA1/START domain